MFYPRDVPAGDACTCRNVELAYARCLTQFAHALPEPDARVDSLVGDSARHMPTLRPHWRPTYASKEEPND